MGKMKISTRARYALRLMIDLANHEGEQGPVILRDVAERQGISKRYLEQLATNLRNARLVDTVQGRGGGYSLARPSSEIVVGEIIEATIGAINVVGCVLAPDSCSRSSDCPSRSMWVRVNQRVNEVFNSVTLADLREGRLDVDVDGLAAAPCSRSSVQKGSALARERHMEV